MVHWNSKYNNFTFASKQDDGLAVLTVFAEVSYNNVFCNMIALMYRCTFKNKLTSYLNKIIINLSKLFRT